MTVEPIRVTTVQRVKTTITLFTVACACGLLPAAEVKPIHKLSRAELEARLEGDSRAMQVQRPGLRSVISYMESRADLFPANQPKTSRLLRREEKEIAWNTWQRFLDYIVALDSIEKYHAPFYRLKGAAKEESFLIGYAAMLAKYRAALEFIERAEHNPELDKVLNDPVPELGLPVGTYARLKFKYLNVAIATDFAAREVLMKTFSGGTHSELRKSIRADADTIWRVGKGRGEVLTARNALKVVQNGAQSVWLPVQQGVSEWMGDAKIHRRGRSLISQAQIKEIQAKLLPGDVLLERREWYMSNIGLPGFWSHAALYLGTPEERGAFFADPDTQAWVKNQGEPSGDFESLLRRRYPKAYANSLKPQEQSHAVRVVEAISEGVSFTTLEHSADCDSLVALRPKLAKAEKAQALVRAFHYAGRPYDFNFDFATDSELVCTELIYKTYESAVGFRGLTFPLVEMLGRKVTPANEIARQFDAQCETAEEQFELVIFLDGQERHTKAVEASLATFRESWRRPKWHVFVQE